MDVREITEAPDLSDQRERDESLDFGNGGEDVALLRGTRVAKEEEREFTVRISWNIGSGEKCLSSRHLSEFVRRFGDLLLYCTALSFFPGYYGCCLIYSTCVTSGALQEHELRIRHCQYWHVKY
ncbi:hypothetical protein BT69DRAFT_325809 [Atractiella rhizophila]|nr:hypothetical protein BT69DRAFT_325809 [Atractiella rhizophila]